MRPDKRLKLFVGLAVLGVVTVSCSDPRSEVLDAATACADYVRAYKEESDLDPFAEAVIEALDDQSLTAASAELGPKLEEIEKRFPGISELTIGGTNKEEIVTRFGPSGLAAVREYVDAFKSVDELLRAKCEAVSALSLDSDSVANSTSQPVTTAPPNEPINSVFLLDRPIQMEFCYQMDMDICRSDSFRRTQIDLGYRLIPDSGLPSAENRSEAFWKSLSPKEQDEYLRVALWNFAARLGVSGGKQSLSNQQIKDEYSYMKEWAAWMVNNLSQGKSPVVILETARKSLRENGDADWLIDWRINAMAYIALPAIAPDFIDEVDDVIVYKD